jgi:DNA-damage-inducible protein J
MKGMKKVSTNISIDPKLKEESIKLFSEFGLDLSTGIALFLQQAVREKRIPFEVRLEIPNKETKEALDEFPEMKANKKKYKRYASFDEVLKGIE